MSVILTVSLGPGMMNVCVDTERCCPDVSGVSDVSGDSGDSGDSGVSGVSGVSG